MRGEALMKGQDIGLLLILVSLHQQEQESGAGGRAEVLLGESLNKREKGSQSTEEEPSNIFAIEKSDLAARYTARNLEETTGISKSQINLALNRCLDVGLAKKDRQSGVPRTNTKVLYNFIVYGLKYVFPAKPGQLTRGIATAFAAPVLNDKLMSAGELV